MLSPLLILAEIAAPAAEAASHGEAAGGITRITQDFGISVPFLLAQIVNFSVVAFILWKFAFHPVRKALDERQKKIAAGLKYAEEMQAKLAATQQESAQLIKTAQLEAQKLVDLARKAAKDLGDRQQAEAVQRAADMLAQAQQAIALEQKKMLEEARSEIARLVVVTTERVLAKKLSEADRSAYNEAASQELSVL